MRMEVKNLHKSFGEKEVLHGISFSIESGKALGLLGRNGAGKTTTIRILMDVFHANEGEVLLDGKPFKVSQHQIGYLPEERGLYPKKTVIEQMIYLARLRGVGKAVAKENAKKWLKRLEVSEYETRKLETLSKGNQQKIQLAATLVSEPEIIILDEPFSGLDPVNSQILKDVVLELINEGRIVIFSSHQMSYVEEFCDNITVINQGVVVLDGELYHIKREFGKDQLVINAENYTPPQLEDKLKSEFSDVLEITGRKKDYCIVKRIGNVTKKQILEKILQSDVELEHFEDYKPSLNDIFVAKVGNDA